MKHNIPDSHIQFEANLTGKKSEERFSVIIFMLELRDRKTCVRMKMGLEILSEEKQRTDMMALYTRNSRI